MGFDIIWADPALSQGLEQVTWRGLFPPKLCYDPTNFNPIGIKFPGASSCSSRNPESVIFWGQCWWLPELKN